MEGELFKLAAGDGIWPALFVALFLYTIYDSRNREKRYEKREDSYQETIQDNQVIIKDLSKKYDIVDSIHKDIGIIHKDVTTIKSEIRVKGGGQW